MGGCCCHVQSPGWNTGEERSGLLKDNSKASTQEGKSLVVGTCGPEDEEDMRCVANDEVQEDVKAARTADSPEVREAVNGPQQVLIETSSPRKIRANSPRAQGEAVTEGPAGGAHAHLSQCTFIFPKKELSTANCSAAEAATPALAAQDGSPVISTLTTQAVCANNQTEINPTTENLAAPDDDDDDDNDDEDTSSLLVEAEACGQVPGITEVLSQPNSQPPSVAVVRQEEEQSSPGWSFGVSGSASDLEPTGLGHSGVLGQPEDAAQEECRGESLKSDEDAKADLKCPNTSSPENIRQGEVVLTGQGEDRGVIKSAESEEEEVEEEVEENVTAESGSQTGNDAEIHQVPGEEEQPANSPVDGADGPFASEEDAKDDLGNSDEDLYRGAEELLASQDSAAGFLPPLWDVEDRRSLAPAMDILSYSQREWRGNTAKSALIRKGYTEMSGRFGSLRRVRGDNYCALRATLFQVFTHSTQLPSWLLDRDVTMLPDQLEAQEGLISGWSFPEECLQGDGRGDAILQMKGYTELLRTKWQAALDCSSLAERQSLCEHLFQGGEEELGLLEATKLLMLTRALELHGRMQAGGDVPLFCWLLFARDSSDSPRSFLCNHLSHVGLGAGLEQVEMFLLGYTLECTIQVYRLYKADTEEFVTYYPDDHKADWPSVCLVTEDDRHYNVPVVEATERAEADSSRSPLRRDGLLL